MINKKYLNSALIQKKIIEFYNKKTIWYLVFENFLDSKVYDEALKEFNKNNYSVISIDNSSTEWRANKTIFIKWKVFKKINDFFVSKSFENFLWLFFKSKLEREFYLKEKLLVNYNNWLIAQMYEKWDYYKWHIDWLKNNISLWSFIYYFKWYFNLKDNLWWELELWKWNWWNLETYKIIKPKSNSLIILLYSDISFHRVKEIISNNFKRISIQATLKKI